MDLVLTMTSAHRQTPSRVTTWSDRRAGPVRKALRVSNGGEESLRIAIKCPVPRESVAQYWGDYHLAQSLGRALTRRGCRVRIDIVPQWYDGRSRNDDLIIVLRGLSNYRASREQFNFCWIISHPNQITDTELETSHRKQTRPQLAATANRCRTA